MLDDKNALYAAFKARDSRFDGRFFVGVSSTGIYCRPVCRARRPRIDNCSFFGTAAEAELAGYRPCLLCRPELAPGRPRAGTPAESLAHRAARMLEEGRGQGDRLDGVAARLGCSVRHMRRVFMEEYRVPPVRYLQTCRLLLAKSLLTDTGLPVIEVAMAAGFGSLRRLNALFRERYGLTPTDFRGRGREGGGQGAITLSLGYRPPYRLGAILGFLGARAIAGVEKATDREYSRTARLVTAEGRELRGWLKVGRVSGKDELGVTVGESLLPVLPQVLARVRGQFDLGCDPDAVHETLAQMNDIRPGLCVIGTRLPGCFDPFEMAVRAVLGQQVTVRAAGTLAARIAEAFGSPLRTGLDGLGRVFPSPGDVAAIGDDIAGRFGELGVTSARSRTILELARAFERGGIDFDCPADPEEEMKKLTAIRGIGDWTAGYIAMRAMGFTDAFLGTDHGVKKALWPLTPGESSRLAEAWRPWRGYAVVNLWNSLGGGQNAL